MQDSVGREIRVFDGEVESLTEAGQRGVGVRCWIDHRVGYAYGTDLGDAGLREIAAARRRGGPGRRRRRVRRAARGDRALRAPEIAGLADPELAEWKTRAEGRAGEGDRADALARPTRAWSGSRRPSTPTRRSGWRSPPPPASPASTRRPPPTPTSRRSPRTDGDADRPRLRHGPLARGARPARRSAARAPSAPPRCSAPPSPASRTCPVVLDPTVAASFAGFIGGTLCADAVQRGRSPFAGRLGEEVASGGPHPDRRRDRPGRAQLLAVRRRGRAPRANAADRGRAAWPPTSTTPTPPAAQGGGSAQHGQRRALGLPLAALGLDLEPDRRRPGAESFEELLAEAGDGVYVTDVAGLHSGVNPVSGTFSVGATGRLIDGGELAAPPTSSRSPPTCQSMLKAVIAAGSEPAGSRSAARSGPRRC